MTYPWYSRQLIVGEGGHMILKHFDVILDDVRRSAILLVANQLLVRLDEVGQLVCQVVLSSVDTKY